MKELLDKYEKQLREYIIGTIPKVLKEPYSFIKYPFIDPGSVYKGNIWDWDTYWCTYGLLNLDKDMDERLLGKVLRHAKGNVFNFLDHQLEDGYIPMMIEVGEWPEPYLNMKHKQGVMMNMHKPFLCQQIELISEYCKDFIWIEAYYEQLERYFSHYKANYLFENSGLYVWCDDIMIGVDNDPASFGRPKFSTANIFLNSFMVKELKSMSHIASCLKMQERKVYYEAEAKKLKDAINEECWDQRDQIFYSVDVDVKTRKFDWFHQGLGIFWRSLPIKIRCWSSFIPMYVGFAGTEQASALRAHMMDPHTFNSKYGITSLAMDEKMFNLEATNNPSNWLGGIWIITQYICFKALLNYGYREEATSLCEKSLEILGKDLLENGCFHEYYDPFTGKGIMNGGFLNWNILILNMIDDLKKSGER